MIYKQAGKNMDFSVKVIAIGGSLSVAGNRFLFIKVEVRGKSVHFFASSAFSVKAFGQRAEKSVVKKRIKSCVYLQNYIVLPAVTPKIYSCCSY